MVPVQCRLDCQPVEWDDLCPVGLALSLGCRSGPYGRDDVVVIDKTVSSDVARQPPPRRSVALAYRHVLRYIVRTQVSTGSTVNEMIGEVLVRMRWTGCRTVRKRSGRTRCRTGRGTISGIIRRIIRGTGCRIVGRIIRRTGRRCVGRIVCRIVGRIVRRCVRVGVAVALQIGRTVSARSSSVVVIDESVIDAVKHTPKRMILVSNV